MRVLLVEDEPRLAQSLRKGLTAEHFVVELAENGRDGLDLALNGTFDVVVLDIMLPHVSGYDICREMRRVRNLTPVIMLTAKNGHYDEADAFDLGADAYLTKPFSFVVLVARLRSLVRRSAQITRTVVRAGDLVLDPATRRVTHRGEEVRLTPTEFNLLRHLMTNAGTVISKREIAAQVWDEHLDGDNNLVEVYVGYLRRKLAADPSAIETVRGVGYRLVTT